MASMNYFNSSRKNIAYILNGTWKSVITSDWYLLLGVAPMQRMKNSEKLTHMYMVFSTGQYHCRQRAPIENVWSTSGIF
jgi:hypothetical protein